MPIATGDTLSIFQSHFKPGRALAAPRNVCSGSLERFTVVQRINGSQPRLLNEALTFEYFPLPDVQLQGKRIQEIVSQRSENGKTEIQVSVQISKEIQVFAFTLPDHLAAVAQKMMVENRQRVHSYVPLEFESRNQKEQVTREDIDGVPSAFSLHSADFFPRLELRHRSRALSYFVDVLSTTECEDWIRKSEKLKYFADGNVGASGFQLDSRSNQRVMVTLSEWQRTVLFSRIESLLPSQVEVSGQSWSRLSGHAGLNDRFRFYKYATGEVFSPHWDISYNRNENETSLFTILLYLNDDLDGGQTTIWPRAQSHAVDGEISVSVNPKRGSALIFPHVGPNSPLHAGSPHNSPNKYKYSVRSDIVYKKSAKS